MQTWARRRRRLGDPPASINRRTHALENANGARTIDDDKKQRSRSDKWKKKCARPTEARRDNVCEFVRSSDARGRRPSGRSADGRVVRDGRGRARCASFVSIGGARGEEEEGCRRRWARARTVDDEENARGAIDRVGVRDGDRGVGSGVDGERM